MLFKLIWSVVVIAVCAYVLFFLAAYILQGKLIFLPSKIAKDYTYKFESDFTEYNDSINGHNINSVLFTTPNPKGLILYFHGNAGDMLSWSNVAIEIKNQTHWNVWMIDYYGYGKSKGKVTSAKALYQIGDYFYKKAKELYPTQKIIIYGRSIGTGIATKVAKEHIVDGLILESPYFNFYRLVNEKVWLWIPRILLRFNFNNNKLLPKIDANILIFHGTKDTIIPLKHSMDLVKTNPRAQLIEVLPAGHNDVMAYPEYWSALNLFMTDLNSP